MTRKHHQFSVNTSENRSLLLGIDHVILVISVIACYLLWARPTARCSPPVIYTSNRTSEEKDREEGMKDQKKFVWD